MTTNVARVSKSVRNQRHTDRTQPTKKNLNENNTKNGCRKEEKQNTKRVFSSFVDTGNSERKQNREIFIRKKVDDIALLK